MSVRAVLFDLGHTLLHYPTQGYYPEFRLRRMREIYPLVCRVCDEPNLPVEEFAATVSDVLDGEKAHAIEANGRSWHFAERLSEGLAAAGLTCDEVGLKCLTEAFCEPIGSTTRPYPETAETLGNLRAAGLRLAIVSNTPWDVPGSFGRRDVERWDLDGFFEAMVFSGDVLWRKPNPEFMWAAARELDVEPETCLVVGDSLKADIAGARAAGMRCVWVNRDDLAGGDEADWVRPDLQSVMDVIRLG